MVAPFDAYHWIVDAHLGPCPLTGVHGAARRGLRPLPVLDREARFAAGEGATTLGYHPFSLDHLRSSVLCIQCRQARGGIPLVAISVRACMPVQRIFTSRKVVLVHAFYFDLTEGSLGKHRSRLVPLEANSVRACPQRTQTAPIYSAQIRPSVRKRNKVARELRDQALMQLAP